MKSAIIFTNYVDSSLTIIFFLFHDTEAMLSQFFNKYSFPIMLYFWRKNIKYCNIAKALWNIYNYNKTYANLDLIFLVS